jgi:hypothetical protein
MYWPYGLVLLLDSFDELQQSGTSKTEYFADLIKQFRIAIKENHKSLLSLLCKIMSQYQSAQATYRESS